MFAVNPNVMEFTDHQLQPKLKLIVSALHLNFFKDFGLIVNNLDDDKSFKVSKIYAIGVGICLLGYISGVIYCLCVPYYTGKVNELSLTANTIILLVELVTVLILIVSRFIKASLLPEMCLSLERTYEMLGNDKAILNGSKRHSILAIFLTLMLTTYVQIFVFSVLYLDYHSTTLLYRIVSMIPKILFAMAMCYAYCVLITLLSFWKRVVNMLSRSENITFVKPKDLTSISQLQQELIHGTQLVAKYFGPVFLAAFASSFTNVTTLMYHGYGILKILLMDKSERQSDELHRSWSVQSMVVMVNSVIFHVVLIASVTITCERIVEKSNVAVELVNKLNSEYKKSASSEVVFCLFVLKFKVQPTRVQVRFYSCLIHCRNG